MADIDDGCMLRALIDDDPPPDAGLALFLGTFLLLPLVLTIVLVADAEPKARGFGVEVWMPNAVFVLVAPWVYGSRTRAAVVGKCVLAGVLAVVAPLLYAVVTGYADPGGHDMALAFTMASPFILAGGALYGALSALIVLVAFAGRQHRRATWLARVAREGHPRYRVAALSGDRHARPPFLRFRDGNAALHTLVNGTDECIAIVPLR